MPEQNTQREENKLDEWMEKIKKASGTKIEDLKEKTSKVEEDVIQAVPLVKNKKTKRNIILVILVFLLAITPRLIFLFKFTDVQNVGIDWYGDVYHHWQVAYLSKEIGFSQGFLRLWDFKGMEFYWGLLHPLVISTLFSITGSISIVILRLVSIVFGSANIVLIFLIVRKYYNSWAAWGAAIFTTFLPVALFSDTVGMQEPLGLFFLLLGIYILKKHPVITGFSWMLAGMERSEFWVFGFALLLIALIRSETKKIQLVIGYAVPCLFYMKYLLNWTENPIYPIWTAYVGTYVGDWVIPRPLTPHQIELQTIFRIILLVIIILSLIIIWKKPKGYLFLLLGFGNIAFFALMHGFGARMGGWIDDTWNGIDRLLSFPYEFLGALLAIILLYHIPKISKHLKYIGMLILICVLVSIQPTWIFINKWHKRAMYPSWERAVNYAKVIADNWDNKHTIIMPSGEPALTYTVSYFQKIPATKLQGDMYSPFYYAESDPFSDWPKFRKKIVAWFKKLNAGYIFYIGNFSENDLLGKMLQLEEGKLVTLKATNGYYRIYTINLE